MSIAEKLVLFGGGKLPELGLKRFFGWAEERTADEVLVVAWASEEAPHTASYLRDHFENFTDKKIVTSLYPPTTEKERARFLSQLETAAGVFFSGGNQNRLAWAFDHPEIGNALRSAYRSGLPFAGTSAGTAMMSELMIAGDLDPGAIDASKVQTRAGLGLLERVLVDQHFLKRQRQNRLFALVLENPDLLGIGVDEDTGLALVDGRFAEVVGPEKVMLVEAGGARGSLSVDVLEPGQSIDLHEYKPRFFSSRVAS